MRARGPQVVLATHRHNEAHVFESQIRIVTDLIAALGSPVLFYAGRLKLDGAEPDLKARETPFPNPFQDPFSKPLVETQLSAFLYVVLLPPAPRRGRLRLICVAGVLETLASKK